MTSEDTKDQIATQIRITKPFTTVNELAEKLPVSRPTILKHIDEVIEDNNDLKREQVGQAQVFYKTSDRLDELVGENVLTAVNVTDAPGRAVYGRLVEGDTFDYVGEWFDSDLSKIQGYRPTDAEIGALVQPYNNDAITIKYYEEVSTDE